MNNKDAQEKSINQAERIVNSANKEVAERYKRLYAQTQRRLADLYAKMEEPSLANAKKYDRLKKLTDDLAKAYREMTGENIATSGKTSNELWRKGAIDLQNSIDDIAGVSYSWGKLPADAIRASIMSEVSGQTYIKTFRVNSASNLAKIEAAITRGLVQGQGIREISKSVQDLFNNGYNDAARVVRTEGLRNYSTGQLYTEERARKLGIEFTKVWLTSIDGRERPEHAAMDGKEAGEDDMFDTPIGKVSGPRLEGPASWVINCRCTVVMEILDDE